jgi:sulfhydrogenase subunit beta (sulfur reductase)
MTERTSSSEGNRMKLIKKSKIKDFVRGLIKQHRLLAPVRTDDSVEFQQVLDPKNMSLEFTNTKVPLKSVFLPQSEVLLRFRSGRTESTEKTKEKTVVLGARPCDVESLALIEPVFDSDDYTDVYYVNKRRNTTIMTLGCNSPSSTCFCTTFGIGPFAKKGSDVFLTDIGSAYVAEGVTAKGKKLIEDLGEADEQSVKKAKGIARKAEKATAKLELGGLTDKLDAMVEHPFWDMLHQTCLGCATCTYLCPTCYCFDIVDEPAARIRNWDSCMFPLYTQEASGHNPRPTGRERWRQRLMHKFNYYPRLYESLCCVGCGRCVRQCPVNLDIRKALQEVLAM